VGYIEGWWVDADLRRTGVGTRLVTVAEAWACSRCLTEMASDTLIDKELSQFSHRALGYQEYERHVCFRKKMSDSA
jgi:aminoglycoside 6'-N-acetyltransferase I